MWKQTYLHWYVRMCVFVHNCVYAYIYDQILENGFKSHICIFCICWNQQSHEQH